MRKAVYLLTLLCPIVLEAQTNAPPTPPYVGAIPPHTAWSVTVQSKSKQADPPPRFNPWHPQLDSITGLKDGKNLKIVSAWKGGTPTETYVVDGVVYKSSSARYPEDVLILEPGSATLSVPKYDQSDFPEFLWAGPENYVGAAREGNVNCNIYEINAEWRAKEIEALNLTPAERKAQLELMAKIPPQRLWVAADTGLPVKYDDGVSIMTYRFSPAGEAKFTISPAFSKVIETYRAMKKAK